MARGVGSLGSNVGESGTRARVILVLRECIWSMPAVSHFLSAFGDTDSLGSPSCQVVYPPVSMVPPWVTDSSFLVGNMKAELKPTTLPSLLLFYVFLSSFPDRPAV